MKQLLVALMVLIAVDSWAQQKNAQPVPGNEGGHGGNDIGLEFQQAFSSGFFQLKKIDPELYQKLLKLDLPTRALQATVIVVTPPNTPLKVKINGVIQEAVATNDPHTNTINVDGDDDTHHPCWGRTQDPHIREGIALHEVMSLVKDENGQYLEDTGRYPYSGKFVGAFNLPSSVITTGVNPLGCSVAQGTYVDIASKNGDGSCTYFNPAISYGGQKKGIYFGADAPETERGFCTLQGQKFIFSAKGNIGYGGVGLNSQGKIINLSSPSNSQGSQMGAEILGTGITAISGFESQNLAAMDPQGGLFPRQIRQITCSGGGMPLKRIVVRATAPIRYSNIYSPLALWTNSKSGAVFIIDCNTGTANGEPGRIVPTDGTNNDYNNFPMSSLGKGFYFKDLDSCFQAQALLEKVQSGDPSLNPVTIVVDPNPDLPAVISVQN